MLLSWTCNWIVLLAENSVEHPSIWALSGFVTSTRTGRQALGAQVSRVHGAMNGEWRQGSWAAKDPEYGN
jgi:hypothetical protein